MRNLEKEINFYKELAHEIKNDGFRCFLYNKDFSAWLYIITPDNSWLYVGKNCYFGFDISYQYTPSRECGSGCRYNEEPLFEITKETLLDAEKYGKSFKCKNGRKYSFPKHYTDGYEAMRNSYFGKDLIEL